MYGNMPFGDESDAADLTPEQRKALRSDLASVAARTRDFLPGEFVVGSEIVDGANGPRATVAVQPPIGSMVSADYSPEAGADVAIADDEREDLAVGLAASAVIQVKQATPEDKPPRAG